MARSRTRTPPKRRGPKKWKMGLAACTVVLAVCYANLGKILSLWQGLTAQNRAIVQSLEGGVPSEESGEGGAVLEKGESWTDFSALLPQTTAPADTPPEGAQKPEGAMPTEAVDLAVQSGVNYQSAYIKNKTSLSDGQIAELLGTGPGAKIQLGSDQPQVLIVHTHATESYEPYDLGYYDPDASSRNTDNAQNVTRVGEEIARQLNAAGIKTVQDKTQHDYPQYTGAYDRSRETIQSYLKKYPSIQVVLDVHRDAIQYSDGTRAKPTTVIDGKKAAQVMFIVGCNSDKTPIPNYEKNLRFAANLQSSLAQSYDDFMRPILFDYRFYNQDLAPACILIEVGGHGNSLGEAVYSGQLIGKGMAEYLKTLA